MCYLPQMPTPHLQTIEDLQEFQRQMAKLNTPSPVIPSTQLSELEDKKRQLLLKIEILELELKIAELQYRLKREVD